MTTNAEQAFLDSARQQLGAMPREQAVQKLAKFGLNEAQAGDFHDRAVRGATGSREQSSSELRFPQQAIGGSLGELARVLSVGTEVAEEFIYATAITAVGAAVSGKLQLSIGLDSDTRLYTVLLGESYTARKSSALKRTLAVLGDILNGLNFRDGVGSAEGLARFFDTVNEMDASERVLLALDEFRTFIEKTKATGSVLLQTVASLFEKRRYGNSTKHVQVQIESARLSIVGCCTLETYEHMWHREAIAIGLPNRLFVVNADAKPKVAWPAPLDEQTELSRIKQRIAGQLARLPVTFNITPEAKQLWEQWYLSLPRSEHAKRLDTIGFRLLPILALTMDKETIDAEVIKAVTAILDYELKLRITTDPIDAENLIARLEEKIRRRLQAEPGLSKRELRRKTNADRDGIWAFEVALKNLSESGDVGLFDGLYRWTG